MLYDNACTDKTSNWTLSPGLTVAHSTDHYELTSTAADKVASVYNNVDKVRFELVLKSPTNTNNGGIHIGTSGTSFGTGIQMYYNSPFGTVYRTNGSWSAGTRQSSPIPPYDEWNRFIIETNGNSHKCVCETENGNTVYFDYTNTKSISTKYYCISIGSAQTFYCKEIKIKPL